MNPSLGGEPAPADLDGLAEYPSELGPRRQLTPDEAVRLAAATRAGDRRAAALLVEAHLHLVVAIARRYASCGVPFLELVQEGNVGLQQAVDDFDPARGCRFSTYACCRIGRAVRQAVADQGRFVRVPPATAEALNRLRRAADRLGLVLGREPTVEELAAELATTVERTGRLVRLSRPAPSLDGLGPEPPGASPADDAVLDALRIDLYAVLARLTARERRVLRLRYGLVDGRRCHPEEIGRRLGLSSERIRQIEREALTRLRRAAGAPRLAGHQDEPSG